MLYRMTAGSPIFGLRREIDRLFDDTFARDGNSWTPAVDIKETDNEIRLELELPGLKPEDVEITAANGLLTIRGEKRPERKEDDDSRYQVVERAYGTFVRTFQLPHGVDEGQIGADCDSGVLSLHIPKAALPQPKRIQISTPSETQKQKSFAGSASSRKGDNSTQGTRSSGPTPWTQADSSTRELEGAVATERH